MSNSDLVVGWDIAPLLEL